MLKCTRNLENILRLVLTDSFCAPGSSEFWASLQQVSPHLKDLAKQIPSLLLQDKAASTVKNYLAAFRRWVAWANQMELPSFPAQATDIALYLVHLMQSGSGKAPVIQALAALHWMHVKADHKDPTTHPTVSQLKEAICRILSRPACRRIPLSLPQFRQVLGTLSHHPQSLADKQLAAFFSLGFTALLRWDDLSRLKASDIRCYPSHMRVFLQQRKNDQFREGQYVIVSRNDDSNVCPVAAVESFLQEGHHHPSDPLFCRVIRAPRSGDYLSGKMSYTRARELIREGLQRAGIHPDGLGTHSLRSGGATAAANAGVADRLIQRHGGWRCATSQHCYIEENLSDLMSVSQHIMGIH